VHLLLSWNDYYSALSKAKPMRTQVILTFVCLSIASLLAGCQKERSDATPDNATTTNTPHTIAVSFSPNTINITTVDSVVVDLISGNEADYRHITLEKMGTRYVSTGTVPEMGYEAYIIIYLHSENSNNYALLYHQVYGGGKESLNKAAPKALTDEAGWQLMGRAFNRENEFFALVGVSPANPMLYLFTNTEKRDYIYVDRSYMNNDQHVASGTYEYHATTPLTQPTAIKDAFLPMASQMQNKVWTTFSSMTLAMNNQTGQENMFYLEFLK
jgi:hypothetical protein